MFMEKNQMKGLKLNYHMLEACNYGCKFCFARYDKKIHLEFYEMKTVVQKTAECGCFKAINFAGGEPFLIKELPDLIRFAKELGLETSVITNGFFLTEQVLEKVLPYLDCIGISVHSFDDEIKRKTGVCNCNNQVLENNRLQDICRYIRNNSDCKIKINTVVNVYNKDEDFVPLIRELDIDRWKILRCQYFENNAENKKMLVSDSEWKKFCERNIGVKGSVFEQTMKDSYIMVNPYGVLLKNDNSGGYEEIGSVLESDLKRLLLNHPLNLDEYQKRYSA